MDGDLGYGLHALTARLDRAADRLLRAEYQLPYRRFLVLFMVGQLNTPTQRALAERLGVSEPSISRMVSTLAGLGLLDVHPDPAGGHRRSVGLTPDGERLVRKCAEFLSGRLVALIKASGVPYDVYARYTDQLLAALESYEKGAG